MTKDSQATKKTKPVKTRLVLNFPGFEPTDSAAQLGRLNYAAQNTGKVWGFETHQTEAIPHKKEHHTIAEQNTKGANWNTKTKIVQFRWNDIVHEYEKAPFPMGFLKSTLKYLAFFTDTTIVQYFKTSPRYWGFTIFPILLILIFAAATWSLLNFILPASIGFLLKAIATVLITLLLCKLLGKKTYLLTTIADWGFARDMANRSNNQIEERFLEFAQTTIREIKASKHDEIIIVGHSFGSIWAIVALAQALEKEANLLNNKKVTFLALGSSLLKIALTPNAQFIRDYWNKVTSSKNLFWHEIQTKNDWIAFYKQDPFELNEIAPPKGGYKIDRIQFKDGMEKKRFKKMNASFYTTHRQYILYYDLKVHFDYMLRLLGPFYANELAMNKELQSRIDQSGKLV